MIPIYSGQVGSQLVEIEWWDGQFPTAEVIAAGGGADVVFVVSPNNPTGAAVTGVQLRELSTAVGFVVLDAAYAEFADDDLTAAALELANVVIVRTFSKAYGLAGLRVGYLLGPPHLIDEISSYGSPYSVSSLSAAIAVERLSRPDDIRLFVESVRSERADLADLLGDLRLVGHDRLISILGRVLNLVGRHFADVVLGFVRHAIGLMHGRRYVIHLRGRRQCRR